MSDIKKDIWSAALLLAAVWPVAAAEEKPAPAEKPAVAPVEKSARENATKEPADEFTVPEGTPKELVAYITKLISSPLPRDAATLKSLAAPSFELPKKVLADKPTETEMEFAVQAKMNMLEKPDQLADFAAELKAGGHEKLARQVHGFMLQIELRKLMIAGGNGKEAVEKAVKFLEEAPPQITDVTLAYVTGLLAEMSEDKELAIKTYGALAKVFAASDNAKLAEFANVLDGVVRRLGLVGHEMKIEGKILGDGAFDWSTYRGKVVLVVFWATAYPSCVRDVLDLKACYDLYHAKGLEIVGISLDRKPADLEAFVKSKAIPWTIVTGDGKPSPSVAYYGIMSLPTSMLVDKDGKVMSLNPRGETLMNQLEKLLGPIEEKKKPATPKADAQQNESGKDENAK